MQRSHHTSDTDERADMAGNGGSNRSRPDPTEELVLEEVEIAAEETSEPQAEPLARAKPRPDATEELSLEDAEVLVKTPAMGRDSDPSVASETSEQAGDEELDLFASGDQFTPIVRSGGQAAQRDEEAGGTLQGLAAPSGSQLSPVARPSVPALTPRASSVPPPPGAEPPTDVEPAEAGRGADAPPPAHEPFEEFAELQAWEEDDDPWSADDEVTHVYDPSKMGLGHWAPAASESVVAHAAPPSSAGIEPLPAQQPEPWFADGEAQASREPVAPLSPLFEEPEPGRVASDATHSGAPRTGSRKWLPWVAGATAAAAVAAVGLLVVAEPEPAPGRIYLQVEPKDATVTLDGEKLAGTRSPYVASAVKPGVGHRLEVAKPGYESWSTEVMLEPEQTLELDSVVLEPTERPTGLALQSEPSGARVLVDGEHVGITPLRLTDLEPGTRRVRVEHGDEYVPFEATVEVARNEVASLGRVALQPAPQSGEEELEEAGDEAEAQAAVAGAQPQRKRARRAARSGGGKKARARTKARRGRSAGWQRRASANSGSRRAGRASSSSQGTRGTLRINTIPESRVYVDGKLVGTTPQLGLSLPAGTRKVTLVNAKEGVRKTLSVPIEPGQVAVRTLRLK